MHTEPQKEHRWLQRLVGEWTTEAEANMGPNKPVETCRGTEKVRSLGGLWVIAEGQGEMPGGGAANMILTIGYDPRRKKYVGTWVGSMMDMMFVYEGTLDAAGTTLTLETEGPNCMDGGQTECAYRDIIEFKSDDHRTLTSQVRGPDGQWTRIMTANYRRTK